MKVFKYKQFENLLKNNGFKRDAKKSNGHLVYRHQDGRHISLPSKCKTLHPGMTKRLIKENNFKI